MVLFSYFVFVFVLCFNTLGDNHYLELVYSIKLMVYIYNVLLNVLHRPAHSQSTTKM